MPNKGDLWTITITHRDLAEAPLEVWQWLRAHGLVHLNIDEHPEFWQIAAVEALVERAREIAERDGA